jgi:hypothetical protein
LIHYHGTPISGGVGAQQALSGKHALVSFANPGHIEHISLIAHSFILDNGAFTAWKQGDEFDLTGYLLWANKWLKHPGCDWALAPDVIDGSEEENDALLNLVSHQRHKFVPVWHMNESIARLRTLCFEWPRVAMGSAGDFATLGTKEWWARLHEAWRSIVDCEGVPLTKIHGLRMLNPKVFTRFPFSSCDSANAAINSGSNARWEGAYAPKSKRVKAVVIMDRTEHFLSPPVYRP